MIRKLGPWVGRVLLVGFGILAALAVLEGLLRLGGVVYQRRSGLDSAHSLPSSGAYRVLCLGESTTAGLATGENSYPRQLERVLNDRAAGRAKFEVINGGKPGTTTDVIVARLPADLAETEPDIVVTMMGINDGHLIDPAFQVGGSLRVWKLIKTLYHSVRPPPVADRAEELLVRAGAALEHWPDVALELAEEANDLVPDDPHGLVVLAEAQVQMDQIDSAAETYLKALEVDGPVLVAYAFEVKDPFIGVLDWVLSRVRADANALAARAVLSLRRGVVAGAEYFARSATEIDPRNPVALVIEGRALELAGSEREAQRRFEAAHSSNPNLVRILATHEVVGSPILFLTAAAERSSDGAEPGAGVSSDERWFLRAKQELEFGFDGLNLTESWQRIARGDTEGAATALRSLTESKEEGVSPSVRLRAYGQLAVAAWQRGDTEQAEQLHEVVEEFLRDWTNPTTAKNYRAVHAMLQNENIPLVAVQYPMRRLEPLRRILEPAANVVFVDNERVFKDALPGRPYAEIFYDLFAGDFGHLTVEGNRILAANVADAVLALVPETRDGGASG